MTLKVRGGATNRIPNFPEKAYQLQKRAFHHVNKKKKTEKNHVGFTLQFSKTACKLQNTNT